MREGVDGCSVGLLEYREGESLLLGECDKSIALISGSGKGLFNKDVEAVLKKILGHCKVALGVGGVDNKVNVGKIEEVGVGCKGLATGVDLLSNRATVLVLVNNVLDVIICVLFGSEVEAVDILAASSLSNYCNV